MKYIFFDIECCDGRHICSFGYVTADEELNLIEKKDILINPQKRFQLQRRGGATRYIELAYRDKQFYNSPNFKSVYPEIKRLLEDEGYLVGGHSIHSDILYLNIACMRYGLPLLKFSYFDTQILYGQSVSHRLNSLDAIAKELELTFEHFHRSDEDAHMSMKILRALAKNGGTPAKKLIDSIPACKGSVDELLLRERKKEIFKRIAPYFERIAASKNTPSQDIRGRRFYFHKQMERDDPLRAGGIVQELVNRGGIYVSRFNQADVWVYSGDESDPRYQEIVADQTVKVTPMSLAALLAQMELCDVTPLSASFVGDPASSPLNVKVLLKRQGQPRYRTVTVHFSQLASETAGGVD